MSNVNTYNAPAFSQPGAMTGKVLYTNLRGGFDSVRQPQSKISTFVQSGITIPGAFPNTITLPVALATGASITVLQTPNGKQAVITEYYCNNILPTPDLPNNAAAIQFSLNNTYVTDTIYLGAATVYDQTGFTPASP